ncbi:MAG: hypothetical protein KBC84_11610 [Proteobacteria bacterium]|nr:hypothetical protein [Pseudomonadota bacterium]
MENSTQNLSTFSDYALVKGLESDLISQITSCSKEDFSSLSHLISVINPSANSLRELFSLLKQISTRDKISLSQILSTSPLSNYLENNSKLSPKDKLKKIKQELQDLRYPESAKLKNDLHELSKTLLKSHGIKLHLPEQLEGDCLTLELSFSSENQLKEQTQKLSALSGDENLTKLFAMLKGKI